MARDLFTPKYRPQVMPSKREKENRDQHGRKAKHKGKSGIDE